MEIINLIYNFPLESEPKLTNRFFLKFNQDEELGYLVESFSGLSGYISYNFWGKRIVEYKPITITLRDFVWPSATQKIIKTVDGIGGLKNAEFYVLDPCSVIISKWKFEIGDILAFDFGNFDYNNPTYCTISLTFKPEKVKFYY